MDISSKLKETYIEIKSILSDKLEKSIKIESSNSFKLTTDMDVRHMLLVGSSIKDSLALDVLAKKINNDESALIVSTAPWSEIKLELEKRINEKTKISSAKELILGISSPQKETYNPLINLTADEIATAVLKLYPEIPDSNPGADYYKAMGHFGVYVIALALEQLNSPVSLKIVQDLISDSDELNLLFKAAVAQNKSEQYDRFLKEYNKTDSTDSVDIDPVKLRNNLGGIAGRLSLINLATYHENVNSDMPSVDLCQALESKNIVFIQISTKKSANLSKLVDLFYEDLKATLIKRQGSLTKSPATIWVEGAELLNSPVINKIQEQGRSASISLITSFKTYSGYKAERRNKSLQNNASLLVYRNPLLNSTDDYTGFKDTMIEIADLFKISTTSPIFSEKIKEFEGVVVSNSSYTLLKK